MRTIGDPLRFALAFELVDDPDGAGPDDRRVSWGRLRVWVGGRNLTLGRTAEGATTDAAEVPLLPVAEWLVQQWEPLLHEERLPVSSRSLSAASWRSDTMDRLPTDGGALDALLEAREAWWQRHGLGSALTDYRIPDLHVRRCGELIELSWDDREWRSVPSGVLLTEQPGRALLPAQLVGGVLFEWSDTLLKAVADQADDAVKARCEVLRSQLACHATQDRREERLRLLAGVDLDAAARRLRSIVGLVDGDVRDTVRALLGAAATDGPGLVTEASLPALLFRASSPRLSVDDVVTLARLAALEPGSPSAELAALGQPSIPPDSLDAITADGVELALRARQELEVRPAAALSLDLDLERVVLPRLGVRVEDVHLDDPWVDGVAVAAANQRPVIAVNRTGRFARTAWGRRMTLAHELCHLLHDVDERGNVAIVSNPWADAARERRANAFAVTLLAPETAIEAVLDRDPGSWTPARLRRVMKELGVGLTTLTRQLQNLGWISASERDAWVDELADEGR